MIEFETRIIFKLAMLRMSALSNERGKHVFYDWRGSFPLPKAMGSQILFVGMWLPQKRLWYRIQPVKSVTPTRIDYVRTTCCPFRVYVSLVLPSQVISSTVAQKRPWGSQCRAHRPRKNGLIHGYVYKPQHSWSVTDYRKSRISISSLHVTITLSCSVNIHASFPNYEQQLPWNH
jgi:hypothetical protein